MRVSLNWIKQYVDLPDSLTPKQLAYDLSLRTVEVESVEYTSEKYKNIIVGKIIKIKNHPNADKLKICITDIGENDPVQIVCGGTNLYEGEYVVVAKPGAKVIWHGEGEPIELKETKVRGESSYGMICGATEIYLDKIFVPKEETEIVDISNLDCVPGQNIAEVCLLDDIILEIDNKSLTNRPDLWGHYGMAREIAAIYGLKLKDLPKVELDPKLPKYKIEIKEPKKCRRYIAIEIEKVSIKESPMWMKALIVNAGMKPINAIVDITNYVMMAVGQPMHAFDRTHVNGNKIIVRNAKKNENLVLLNDNYIELTEDDLVISDENEAMALAGIKGGKKDSVLPETTGILLEIANFSAQTIRKTERRFDERTDSAIRYEKNIDTERATLGRDMALRLIQEIFPESKIISYGEEYPIKTEKAKIDVPKEFLDVRLGKNLQVEQIQKILKLLGYDVEYKEGIFKVIAPVWRSTGDVSIKDDVMGDIARILGYQSFEPKPLPVKFEHAVIQNNILLERRIKEYLAIGCGFNEIYTYPWIDLKYINAAGIDLEDSVKLATPPAPELTHLRKSLIPGMLEAISKNLRYYESFKLFEVAQTFEKGEYHESTIEETLPIHKKLLAGCIVGKEPKEVFYEVKGVIEQLARYCHAEEIKLDKKERVSWADINAYLNITYKNKIIGNIGLISIATMANSKIKRVNVAAFELNMDALVPLDSRENKYNKLPQYPLVEKDLSLIVNEKVMWREIKEIVEPKVKEIEFIEEYKGNQINKGKKSIMLRVKLGKDNSTMTSEQINEIMQDIIVELNKKCGAEIRE